MDIFVNENGIRRLATAEEIAEMKRLAEEMPTPEPDPNEIRMQEIEAALIELAAMLGGA
jgi:hypothetical protein